MIWSNSVKLLEKKVEKQVRDAYSNWEYARCYHLLKILHKINKKNPVFLEYIWKIDKSKLEKHIKKWALGGNNFIKDFITSPKVYLTFLALILLWRIK